MSYRDPDKQRAYQRQWCRDNSPARIERMRQQRQERADFVAEYKAERGCCRCGERDPIVLDLHHAAGEKEASISRMVRNKASWERLLREIAKCVVVCANCHRRIHAYSVSVV